MSTSAPGARAAWARRCVPAAGQQSLRAAHSTAHHLLLQRLTKRGLLPHPAQHCNPACLSLSPYLAVQTFIKNLVKGWGLAFEGEAFQTGGRTSSEQFRRDPASMRLQTQPIIDKGANRGLVITIQVSWGCVGARCWGCVGARWRVSTRAALPAWYLCPSQQAASICAQSRLLFTYRPLPASLCTEGHAWMG